MKHTNTAHNGLSVAAAATRAGVATVDIRDAINRGDIPATRVLYLDPKEVDRWAQKRDQS